MQTQITQELTTTLDELDYQSELAEASALKVRALEEDRDAVVGTYNARLSALNDELQRAREDLLDAEQALAERDSAVRASDEEAMALEMQKAELESGINAERGGIVAVMRGHHDKERLLEETLGQYERWGSLQLFSQFYFIFCRRY